MKKDFTRPTGAIASEDVPETNQEAGPSINGKLSILKQRQKTRRAHSAHALMQRPSDSSRHVFPNSNDADSPRSLSINVPLNVFDGNNSGSDRTPGSQGTAPFGNHLRTQFNQISSTSNPDGFGDQPQYSPLGSVSRRDLKSQCNTPESHLDYGIWTPKESNRRTVSRSDSRSLLETNAHPVAEVSTEELTPVDNPDSELRSCIGCLASIVASKHTKVKWEEQFHAITTARQLAMHHQEVITPQLHALILALAPSVESLRSSVVKNAIVCFGEMFVSLERALDPELEYVITPLVKKAGEVSNQFLSAEADMALERMHGNVSV